MAKAQEKAANSKMGKKALAIKDKANAAIGLDEEEEAAPAEDDSEAKDESAETEEESDEAPAEEEEEPAEEEAPADDESGDE